MTFENEVKRTLKRLGAIDRRCRSSGKRFGSYRYLQEVFLTYADWRRRKLTTEAAMIILEMNDAVPQIGTHPLRVLIDATSKAGVKMKSRFTRALQLIWRRRRKWNDFFLFVRFNGGITGCAQEMTIDKPARWMREREYYYPDVPRKRLLTLDRRRGRFRFKLDDADLRAKFNSQTRSF